MEPLSGPKVATRTLSFQVHCGRSARLRRDCGHPRPRLLLLLQGRKVHRHLRRHELLRLLRSLDGLRNRQTLHQNETRAQIIVRLTYISGDEIDPYAGVQTLVCVQLFRHGVQ